jgi:hypothetical protein
MIVEALMTIAALLIYVALRGIFSEAKKPADEQYSPFVRPEP